ncbi:DNA-3-methyladenine glycosylase, partial [Corynebacterium sp.]|uniref:DNA-3-methyladenine glycosylase n=1 Tax=Corynebacterium sp. TaxID=1720 RepID=UPI0025BD9A1E
MIDFTCSPETVAPQLLGATLRRVTPDGTVAVVLTEVEAYPGEGDPASHTYNGPTPRCLTMFGPPGRLYVYASYGIHRAGNLVCRAEGAGAGVLMRAGRVVEGMDLVRRRRGPKPTDDALARGPGNLGAALGLDLDLNGAMIGQDGGGPAGGTGFHLTAAATPVEWVAGPRIGISKNREAPLRFWIPGDRTVSSPR